MTAMTTTDLKERWNEYRRAHPKARHREAAADLGVSEADLMAAGCGLRAVRLEGQWSALLQELEPVGPLMALTRNDAAVHEKTGVYRNVELHETHQMVLDKDIDLRLFLGRWRYGFAVTLEKSGGRVLRGLQFFDKHGLAVHKIYLRDGSDEAAYEALVEKYSATDASPLVVEARRAPTDETPDEEIDVGGFLESWRGLEDTHDFFSLTRTYGVTRTQALRLGEGAFTRRVDLRSHRHVLEGARDAELPLMVFVRSPGTVQIHTGPVQRLLAKGGWYNVLDEGFNLHLHEAMVDAAWVVKKPTTDGTVTALELYDEAGLPVVQFFGERKPGQPEREDWRAITDGLPSL